ncbi:MAG TPA: SusC/RagA family TonB-linked outer membrane protein [Gemmatimonadales bacterium]|nr:SusC/RagA family TonB-linked outer membrane protein [Gemmatimonadales bacterium]
MRLTTGSRILSFVFGAALLTLVARSSWAQQAGTVAGTVTDQATSQPLPGVRVQLGNTNLVALTNTEGRYTLRAVPVGRHDLRASVIGYAGGVQSVTVEAGAVATADFQLRGSVVSLDAVTVTASGAEQRSREMGNATSVLSAPKILESAPVSDLGDLLSGRGANVQVMSSAGTTGAGTKIRVRGLSSFSLSNEPVYYVDGVRIESGSNSFTIGTGGQAFSRINDLNPEEIESIEIIKGPSASTLYGTQAANGVVRITTKRGVAGRPVWQVWSEVGALKDYNSYPTNYFSYGRLQPSDSVRLCLLFQAAAGACTIDSLSTFNVLEDAVTTPNGTGYRGQLGAQVSGGTDDVRYFFSAEYEDELGHLRMPEAEYSRVAQERLVSELPYEQYRPNDVKKVSLRTNVQANLSRHADISASLGLVRSDGRLPQNDNNVTGLLGSGYFGRGFSGTRRACGAATCVAGQDTTPLGSEWGFSRPGEVFAVLAAQDVNRLTGSGTVNWRPAEFLTGRLTVGMDHSSLIDTRYQALNEGPNFATNRRGGRTDNRTEISQTTVDAGATGSFNINPTLTSRTSAGMQYLRDRTFGVTATGSEFAPGGKTVGSGSIRTAGETTTETITLGFYLEEILGWRDRLFLTAAVRQDYNSAFGADARGATYPKASLSWVISEEDFFPKTLPISNLRLRAAYGASGNQPNSTAALRFYQSVTASIASVDQPGLTISAIGNDSLKPERATELELGFDVDMLEGRGHLEFTYYAKKTKDALVNRVQPPSIGGPAQRLENLGSTQNHGIEGVISVNTRLLSDVDLDLTISGSRNIGKLLTLAPGIPSVGTGVQRQVPGHPLFGWWERPILGYHDLNGDGILVASEVIVGDTSVYLGPSLPQTEMAVNGGLGLFNNRVRITGQLDYRGDFKQRNFTEYFRCTSSAANNCAAVNVPGTPLAEQAAAIAGRTGPGFTSWGYITDGHFLALRELALTYEAPGSWARVLRAQRVALTLTGRNLAKWTSYPGIDPEINGNGQSDFVIDFLTQPQLTYYTFRVSLGF